MTIFLHTTMHGGACLAVAQDSGTMYDKMSVVERKEFTTLHHPRRQQERRLTLFLLHEVLGVENSLLHNENSQPTLQDSPMNISIAHSSDGVVGVIVHPQRRVGLDVESRSRNFAPAVRRFSEYERQFICTNELCGIAWCSKEAAYKAARTSSLNYCTDILLKPFTIKDNSISAEIYSQEQRFLVEIEKIILPQHFVVVALLT